MTELRRHATTIVICLAAVAALVAVLVWDRGAVTTGEALARKKDLFDAWRLDDVTVVAITAKGKTARLVRQKANDAGQRPWDVEIDGELHPAEEQIVDQFLGTLEFAAAERRVAPGAVDKKAMGLEDPREVVEVEMGAQRYHLAVGGSAATPEGAVYVEVKGKGVSVITAELRAALDVNPETFRSRSFVPYVSTDLAAIDLEGTGGRRKLVRAKWAGARDPGFAFADGEPNAGVRVASLPLDKILVALADLQSEAFLDAAEAKQASKPEVIVELTPSDGARKKVTVRIGGVCPKKTDDVVAIRDEPTASAVCVPRAPLEALTVSAAELVDRKLLGAPPDEITEVKIESVGKVLEVARSGAEWHVRRPDDRRADAEVGKVFLGGLLLVQGEVVHEDVQAKSTARIISIHSGSGADAGMNERIEELSWGDAVNGKVLVKRSEDGATIAVPVEEMAKFAPSDLVLRSRKVIDEPLEELRTIHVEGGGRSQRIARLDDGSFELVEPKGEGLAPDPGLVSDVAQALLSLTADQWIADQDDGTHGLASPRFAIEAVLGEPGDAGVRRKVKVAIGASTAAGSFAQKEGDTAVFVAPKALESAANRWLLDRSVLSIDAPQIASATIKAGGKKVELVKHGSAWELRGAIAKADAQAVHDALSDLGADGVISIGKAKPSEGIERPSTEIEVKRTTGDPVKLVFGASDTFEGASVVHVRRAGIDATYVVARSKLKAIDDALGR